MQAIPHDVKLEGWENSKFPIVCETCFGDKPNIRMIRAPADKECRVCNRPFTTFRWEAGRRSRFKNTIICQACARMKNVCQVCLFDLQYGLPVQVRDQFLSGSSAFDKTLSRVNRDYQISQREKAEALKGSKAIGGFDEMKSKHEVLEKLQRTVPYYARNKTKICSFWLRGECNRGSSCPFRHEKDEKDASLENQKTEDRYRGVNDPVAEKILKKI